MSQSSDEMSYELKEAKSELVLNSRKETDKMACRRKGQQEKGQERRILITFLSHHIFSLY